MVGYMFVLQYKPSIVNIITTKYTTNIQAHLTNPWYYGSINGRDP